jgi:glycine/D-amino acid oxidase-like deaminating enzyme
MRALVVGAGVFGVAAAWELRARGWAVRLVDPGPIPHPLAESTDISKVVRLDYGADLGSLVWMEQAMPRWRAWNAEQPAPLFHETGLLFLARSLGPASFEGQSLAALTARGHTTERLGGAEIGARFPAWASSGFTEAYFNPQGGYAESGRVVAWLADRCRAAGVDVQPGVEIVALSEAGGVVRGAVDRRGVAHDADVVVLAAGAWTQEIRPALRGVLRATGQAVVHLQPSDPALFSAGRFPVFCADIGNTGRYGFPVGREGVVKLGHHGPGRPVGADPADREVRADEEAAARAWVETCLPALRGAPIVHRRICAYGDSPDGDLWVERAPGLVVAAGGSGHGFKFAPVLGELIADAVEGRPHPMLARFAPRAAASRWREEARATGADR